MMITSCAYPTTWHSCCYIFSSIHPLLSSIKVDIISHHVGTLMSRGFFLGLDCGFLAPQCHSRSYYRNQNQTASFSFRLFCRLPFFHSLSVLRSQSSLQRVRYRLCPRLQLEQIANHLHTLHLLPYSIFGFDSIS